jgi:Ser/Thr protein kinase RdoA (MazF antagonist)
MTQPAASRQYDDLTPQHVLDSLDAVGFRGDGRILQLNSYENRVFQVFLEDGSAVVAKFYRPGRWSDAQILEEHAFAAELQAEEVPVVAPLTLSGSALGDPPTLLPVRSGHGLHRVAVSPRCAGREPELDEPGTLERIGQFLGRCHAVGARRPFLHRLSMDPARDARAARDALRAGPHLEPTVGARWAQVSDEACTAVASAFEAFAQHGPLRRLRLHGDAHRGNVLWREGGPHVVDLDDAVQGPAIQDLWMLVSGDRRTMAAQLGDLLEGYRRFCDFDERELALLEPLRTLRMLRYSAWLAARWEDPAFPRSFPGFGTAAYWQEQITQLQEQLELMAEPPLRV